MSFRDTDGAILASAIRLSELGFAVHWLRPPTGGLIEGRGKAPIDRGWQHRPWLSPAQLRASYRPSYNVGIHTGQVVACQVPVVVIDCDDARSIEWCRSFLPPTPLEVRTRKGIHFYYRRPASAIQIPNRVRVDAIALDIRADGGNVVIPPSVHPEGAPYQWARPLLAVDVIQIPEYKPEWFPAPTVAAAMPLPPLSAAARAAAPLMRARAYARSTPGAVSGQGGSLATFKLAVALVRGFALSDAEAITVLAEEYNPRCEPPWSAAELTHKLRYARQAGRVAVGSLLGAEPVHA